MPKTASRPSRTGVSKSKSSSARGAARKSTRAAAPRRRRSEPKPSLNIRLPKLSNPLAKLSPERRLDVLGVFMALVGLLVILSLLSEHNSVPVAWVVLWVRRLAGWGAFVIPLALLAAGLWLIFRRLERLPVISAERLTGSVLLYLNLLAWAHLASGGGWELAYRGGGGGYLGGFPSWILVHGLGLPGGMVVLSAWLLIALALTLDVSIPELFTWIKSLFTPLRRALEKRAGQPDASAASGEPLEPIAPTLEQDLPPDFNPLVHTPSRPAARPAAEKTPAPARPAKVKPEKSAPAAAPAPEPAGEEGNLPAPEEAATVPNWVLPPVDQILDPPTEVAVQTNVDSERARVIEETLASFGAPAHVVEIHRGPTVTQFGVEPDFIETRSGRTRVRVSKIASLADDLALALAAPRIRIQAPVPGRNYVGIEVANAEPVPVVLREIFDSPVYKRVRSPLKFTLGKDVAGAPVVADLAAMPHLLIAGTTGSGKSVCVNSILCSLLLNNTPNELRLVLVDPKRVELTGYNNIPHLLAPVITDAEKVVGALQWMQREMDARYHRFSQVGARNIQDYNSKQPVKLPYIVAVIDELADLMMLAPDETERAITRLAQLARATGIHLILATQRPSVDVVTGLIKANFPARIAFAVASGTDSRVILDQPGAERLLGRGDMLYQAPDAPGPVRLQGVYVSDPEIQRLVDYWRTAAAMHSVPVTPTASGEPVDSLPSGVPLRQVPLWEEGAEESGDPLYSEAVELVRKEGRASITMLQRRMRIGYTRAARLIDAMEEKGIVGPPVNGSQMREVLDYGQTAPPEDDGY